MPAGQPPGRSEPVPSMVEADGLEKTFRAAGTSLTVVRGVSFRVARGEVVAIQGPSGAGKSTLLYLLGGLEQPTRGRVIVDGVDLYAVSERERARLRNRRLGFVFQLYHLLPEFTALENVMLPGLIQGWRARAVRDRARGLLTHLGLGARLRHKPTQLSGGEQQRVAIARALVNEPDVLLCDEPTGNLDSRSGEQIETLLFDMSRERGQTVILVTHEVALAQRAHRMLHIRDGQLVGSGES